MANIDHFSYVNLSFDSLVKSYASGLGLPDSLETDAGGSKVQSLSGLQSKFKASLQNLDSVSVNEGLEVERWFSGGEKLLYHCKS